MAKYRIQKSQTTIAVAHAAQAVFSTANVALNGILFLNKIKIASNSDGGATMTLALIDAEGDTVYSKSGVSGSAGTVVTQLTGDQRVALSGNYTVQVTFSANQTTTDNTLTVTLNIDRG